MVRPRVRLFCLALALLLIGIPEAPRGQDIAPTLRAYREKLLRDPYRPGYHFVIPEGHGGPFDPNGAIYWKGRYHLFYIYQNPPGKNHMWGHVSSTDLLHWRHHPTGLIPPPNGPEHGLFSGNCFLDKSGRPVIMYHGLDVGNSIALSTDDELNDWVKMPGNPITPKTKPGDPYHGMYASWDPHGWLENGSYYGIFGGGRPALVKSPELEGEWKWLGDFFGSKVKGDEADTDVSCPDFFKLGDKYMLLGISHNLGCRYYLGDWKNEKFYPTFHGRMSWVDSQYFAPESLSDPQGRRIMWAWLKDTRPWEAQGQSGWSGMYGLPRCLSLGRDGMLRINPPAELDSLRINPQTAGRMKIEDGADIVVPNVRGNSLEIVAEFAPGAAGQCGVKVCRSPDGREQTSVYYDAREKKLAIDTRRSGLGFGDKAVEAGPLSLKWGEALKLRIYVDKSIVEVFANDGRQAVCREVFPTLKESVQVSVFASGGAAKLKRFRAWEMMPANPY